MIWKLFFDYYLNLKSKTRQPCPTPRTSQVHSSTSPLVVSPVPSLRLLLLHLRKLSLPSRPRIPTQRSFQERWRDTLEWVIASRDILVNSELLPSGEETLLTASDTYLLPLATSCSRIPSRECSQNITRRPTSPNSLWFKLPLVPLLVVLPTL